MSGPDAALPAGFTAHVANIGIRDDTHDIAVVLADQPCAASALFTRSRFVGCSVELSRAHVADGALQAVVVISKNANVATGSEGKANAEEIVQRVADRLGLAPDLVLLASTGVIGRQYPMDRVRAHLDQLEPPAGTDATAVARAMMTTDTVPKIAVATAGAARVVGVAKGVGMIEPRMATMLAFVFTDAQVAPTELDLVFRTVVDRTFNCLSIDTDTSTSDTAAVLASGIAGPVDPAGLEAALSEVCLSLTRQLARDGEGAEKLLVVEVTGAADGGQARRVAKSVVNSPLVKTAVHGADPNWGRVVMAVGKCEEDTNIDQHRVTVTFADHEVYPTPLDGEGLAHLETLLRADEVHIGVDLGIADGRAVVYGCDLTDGYVRINADYTT
ncbi:MAG: bifunctional glutamate N-acetyltransferase/amino-acid acetyltransferase ArgJ [Acidimicrobiia bacterium]|nr:bifunctional glutamate N-acetyltransferase/amino-acid acetyltransferase ArgJ [Acidimicrobiia bacterium]